MAASAILAEFKTPGGLYRACERVRDAGYTRWDAHTPFPVHGLDGAMGMKRSACRGSCSCWRSAERDRVSPFKRGCTWRPTR
jgi:hypothetical protein